MDSQTMIVSSILTDPDQFHLVADLLAESDFTEPNIKTIWSGMVEAVGRGLPANELIDTQADQKTVFALASAYYRTSNIVAYAKALRDSSKRARLVAAIEDAKHSDDPVTVLMQAVDKFASNDESLDISFGQLMTQTVDYLDTVHGGSVGIPTGIPAIDQRIGGWQPGRLCVVAARTGMGKTALTLQMALEAARGAHRVGILSLEMSAHELGVRTLANVGKINVSELFRAEEPALADIAGAIAKINDYGKNLFFNVDQYRLTEVLNQIRLWVKRDGVNMVVVDHIGLVEVPDAVSANDRLGQVTRALKKMAKEMDVPILAVSQLNRSNVNASRMPVLSDLRDSGSIEQDADICLFLHKNETVENDEFYRMGLLKNRQGPAGWMAENGNLVSFDFMGEYQTFRQVSHDY